MNTMGKVLLASAGICLCSVTVLAQAPIEVFVNGAATPSLSVADLGEHRSGGVALFVGTGSDGAFANLTITPTSPAGPPPASTQNIFQASMTGNLTRVQTLVAADAQALHARNGFGLNPLHAAALYGQRSVAEYLLAIGADPNAVARHSGTPLDVAAEADWEAFVAWLQSRGARFTPLRFDVTQVGPNTRRIAFPWGMMNNVLVFSGPDGAIVVDSGFSRRAVEELRNVIAGFSKAGVQYLINSHGHGDHVAGNAIAPSPGAVITGASLAASAAGLPVTRDTQPLKGRTGRTLPVPHTLRVGGADIKLVPRPGLHSDADVMVYFPAESVVAMGDLLLSESVPAVEDTAGYLAFLDDVLDVFPQNTTFVSGHGRDLDAAGVKSYRDTVAAMADLVRTNLAAGRTVEQMVKDDILKPYQEQFSLLQFLAPNALIPRVVTAAKKEKLEADRKAVEQAIRDSIGWALTKDRPTLERVITHDADLFIFHPDSTSTVVGWEAFAKNFDFWMDPRFKDGREIYFGLAGPGYQYSSCSGPPRTSGANIGKFDVAGLHGKGRCLSAARGLCAPPPTSRLTPEAR